MPLPARALRVSAVVVVVAALAAGCSTALWDTSEADNPPAEVVKQYSRDTAGVRQSLVDHLSDVGDDLNEWAAPVEQAECAADRILERLGVDRLLALGYEPTDGNLGLPYRSDERTALLNILTGCIDFSQGIVELLSSYQKLDYESSACVSRGLERRGLTRDYADGLLRGAEIDPFVDDYRVADGTTRVLVECLDEDEDLLPLTPDLLEDDTTTTTEASDEGEGEPEEATTTTEPSSEFGALVGP